MKWVKTKDRLPSKEERFENGEFIVMIEGASNPTALLYDGEEFYEDLGTITQTYDVTHWMPFPDPPEEVGKDES